MFQIIKITERCTATLCPAAGGGRLVGIGRCLTALSPPQNGACDFHRTPLKHLKGRVKDPSAVIQPAGCTILHVGRFPDGEGSTSGTKPPTFATPSIPIPPLFSCRDTRWKSARFRGGSCCLTAQSLSTSLQGGLRLLHPPLPAALSACLAARFPWWENYGLTTFRLCTRTGEVWPLRRGRVLCDR